MEEVAYKIKNTLDRSSKSPHHHILTQRQWSNHMLSSCCSREGVQKQELNRTWSNMWVGSTKCLQLGISRCSFWFVLWLLFFLLMPVEMCGSQKWAMVSYNNHRRCWHKERESLLVMWAWIPTMFQLAVNVPHVLNSRYIKLVNLQDAQRTQSYSSYQNDYDIWYVSIMQQRIAETCPYGIQNKEQNWQTRSLLLSTILMTDGFWISNL